MEVAPLEAWMRRRLARDANTCLLLSPLAILGGLLILFLTFWFSYAVIWMVLRFCSPFPRSSPEPIGRSAIKGRLGLTTAFLVLLVVST